MRLSKAPLILSISMLIGCAAPHSDVMVFGTQTNLGVDISSSPEQANIPSFIVGYKRKELVWMPLFINGIDSKLLKYKHKGYYITGKNASVAIPSGASDITLSTNNFFVLPKGTKVKLEPQTELTFTEGSTFSLASGSPNVTLKAGSFISIPEMSLIQDVAGTTYQGIDLHNAKYMAESRDKDSKSIDTYSVLASFGANIEGGTKGSGVGIAQYFATGIAAQNLTRNGGSELVTLQSTDTKLNTELKKQVKKLEKSNLELLKENIGNEKALELSEKNKDKITVEDAKVVLIGNHFSKGDGSLDKASLTTTVNSIDDSDIPPSLKTTLINRTSISELLSNLKASDFLAIDPLFNKITK
ncbi:hypothetical protein [Cognaticolwellia aestuarii]|uniref:hypothetical protein n=1 Tax=Cognaticolwellia aestuarii TaxID=329993 RepID=UPI000986B2CC|nr:hypothetical protein [Cognaticolwellia aestuarii]